MQIYLKGFTTPQTLRLVTSFILEQGLSYSFILLIPKYSKRSTIMVQLGPFIQDTWILAP